MEKINKIWKSIRFFRVIIFIILISTGSKEGQVAEITLKGNKIHTTGNLPAINTKAPDFVLVKQDLSEVNLGAWPGKKKILNIFPSIDTAVCAMSVKKFHQEAMHHKDVVIINISKDLPFAQKRFCGAEGIENAVTLSAFRSSFAKDYGVEISDGALKGLCARAVLVLDANNQVLYKELVPEIAQEPNYAKALETLK